MNQKQKNLLSAGLYSVLKGYVWTIEEVFIKKKDDSELRNYVMKNRNLWKDESNDFFLRSLAKARYAVAMKFLHKRNIEKSDDEILSEDELSSADIEKFTEKMNEIYEDYEIISTPESNRNTKVFKVKVDNRIEKLIFTEEGGLINRIKVEE